MAYHYLTVGSVKMVNKNFIIVLMLTISSCSSMFKTSHELFVDMMNDYIEMGITIERMLVFDGKGLAKTEYVTASEMKNGKLINHYKKPNVYGRYCNYYFIIDFQSRVIEGWGFDEDKSDPRNNCGVSG